MGAAGASPFAALRPILVVMAAVCASPAGADCLYSVTIIQGPSDPIFGPPVTIPLGLNNAGHVVGYWSPLGSDSLRAFLWTPQSGLVTLPMPPGTRRSVANDISDAGHICGWHDVVPDGLNELGFLYHDGLFVSLGTMPGGNFSEAMAVNSAGQVVGCWGNNFTGPIQAFLWQGGQLVDLGPAVGTPNGCANDISERGEGVGSRGDAPQTDARAFVLMDGIVGELGPIPGGYTSVAMAVNQLGDIVGWGSVVDPDCGAPEWHAFLYSDGRMEDLGVLPAHRHSRAMGVTEFGRVAGIFDHQPSCSDPGGFVWDNNGMVDIDSLISPAMGIYIEGIWAINLAGQIVAHGTAGGDLAAFLLTPPERPVGDIDGDCEVGLADMDLLFASWGACSSCTADLNSDQTVNIVDFLLVLSNWG